MLRCNFDLTGCVQQYRKDVSRCSIRNRTVPVQLSWKHIRWARKTLPFNLSQVVPSLTSATACEALKFVMLTADSKSKLSAQHLPVGYKIFEMGRKPFLSVEFSFHLPRSVEGRGQPDDA